MLKKFRPDLLLVLDAKPTDVVFVTNLDSDSTIIEQKYHNIVEKGLGLQLSNIEISGYMKMIGLQSTDAVASQEKMTKFFWL